MAAGRRIFVMSDHGFANFGRQFNLNSWLRDNGYLGPPECTSIMQDVDWSQTYAYGLGINGLYLNLKGRERDGIVEPGEQAEELLGGIGGAARSGHGCQRRAASSATSTAPTRFTPARRPPWRRT